MTQAARKSESRRWSLAIETSSLRGSVAVGLAGKLLAEAVVPAPRRHGLELLPTIARLSEEYALAPDQLGRVYVSLGPGSFTGLRMGIATARMLARATGAKLVGVASLAVLARNALEDPDFDSISTGQTHVAACVRLRTDSVYAQLFEQRNDRLMAIEEASECPIESLGANWRSIACGRGPGPVRVYGELELDDASDKVTVAPDSLRIPHAACLWALGESLADQGKYTDSAALLPLYVRPPEAVEVWEAKLSKQAERVGPAGRSPKNPQGV